MGLMQKHNKELDCLSFFKHSHIISSVCTESDALTPQNWLPGILPEMQAIISFLCSNSSEGDSLWSYKNLWWFEIRKNPVILFS